MDHEISVVLLVFIKCQIQKEKKVSHFLGLDLNLSPYLYILIILQRSSIATSSFLLYNRLSRSIYQMCVILSSL